MGSEEPRHVLPPGTLIGERYRIVSALARGGFGVVYIAQQLATERQVALKLLTSHLADVSVDRLLAEARIASRVSSEHIVQVFDAGIDSESSLVFVAMELLSGNTLAELVQNHGPRSVSETVEYLRQVAAGLDKVHSVVTNDGRPAPIVHRDLKPANLFLTSREDGTACIKILDFGAAKILSENAQSSGVLCGTPEYMSFEQAAGAEITPATDIWAFGLIAFFLLTGRSYWRGSQRESARSQIFGEVLTLPLVPASERARELGFSVPLDSAFDDWFSRCVNRNPAERYPSAGVAARELARALNVLAGPVDVRALEPGAQGSTTSRRAASPLTPDLAGVAASSRSTRTARPRFHALLALLAAIAGVVAIVLWARFRLFDDDSGARHSALSAGSPLPSAPSAPSASAHFDAALQPSSPAPLDVPVATGSAPPPEPIKRVPATSRSTTAAPTSSARRTPAPSSSVPIRALPNENIYDLR